MEKIPKENRRTLERSFTTPRRSTRLFRASFTVEIIGKKTSLSVAYSYCVFVSIFFPFALIAQAKYDLIMEVTKSASKVFSQTVEHPLLTKTDAFSITSFLRRYEHYLSRILKRDEQVKSTGIVTVDVISPGDLFCFNAEWLLSLMALGFIDDIRMYDTLTHTERCCFIESRAEKKDVVSLEKIEKIVKNWQCTNMADCDAK